MTSGNKFPELAHFSWCAQVAVKLAAQDGRVGTQVDQHLFLLSWLVTAHHEKRFPHSIEMDILRLIVDGRRMGVKANLIQQIEAIYSARTRSLNE